MILKNLLKFIFHESILFIINHKVSLILLLFQLFLKVKFEKHEKRKFLLER